MPSNPPTQQFIAIDNIDADVVFLKNGGLRQIIIVSGLNLDLISEEERTTILNLYERFLNGLDFPVQFIVHSRKFNIESYLKNIDTLHKTETNELLKNQIFEYREFIKTFVEQNDIMTKMFLVVVPYNPVTLISDKGFLNTLFSFWKKKPKSDPNQAAAQIKNQNQDLNIRQLRSRSDHVISGLQSVGLRAVVLNNEELTELFYNFYNPEMIEKENLNLASNQPESPSAPAPFAARRG